MLLKDWQCFAHEENVGEDAIVWFKNVMLEGEVAQKTQERDNILFLWFPSLDGTYPETRKRWQKYAGLCKVGPKHGAIEQFLDLGFPTTVKT